MSAVKDKMQESLFKNGWARIDDDLDIEVQHGVPVRLSHTKSANKQTDIQLDHNNISKKALELTGLSISVKSWIEVDKNEFEEVLRRLAIYSAAIFVDRFHKAIDHNTVDWDNYEFIYDFNHAAEHCCIPYDSLSKNDYFTNYIKTMHDESVRLIEEGISPIVEAE